MTGFLDGAAPSPACARRSATSRPSTSSTAPACGRASSARRPGVNIPLQAAEHYYLITEKIAGVCRRLAGARGPGLLRLLPRGGRRPDGRPVRAGLRAVEGRRRPAGLLVRRDPARLGPHGPVPREGDATDPRLARGRRSASSSADRRASRPTSPRRRRGARAEELLRRRRAELDRHPHRRRDRARPRALDRQRAPRRRRHRLEHRPPAPLPGEPRVPRDAHRRVARHGLPVPLPGRSMRRRAARSGRRSTIASPPAARSSAT